MERNTGCVLRSGTEKEFREWLDMMMRRGVCALNDMKSVSKALPEIYGMLRGSLRKNYGDAIAVQMTIKALKVAASVDGKMNATKFFFEDLEECLRHDRPGVISARLVIRAVMRSRGRISFPRSPSAIRHQHFRQASETAYPARLAA